MKSYTLTAMLAAAMMLGSCAKEPSASEETGKAQIRFTLAGSARNAVTRAEGDNDTTYPTTAQPEESKVNSLVVVLYDTNKQFVEVLDPTPGTAGANSYSLAPSKANIYNFYFIANASYELNTSIRGLQAGSTLSDLETLVADQAPDEDNKFLMTSAQLYTATVNPGMVTALGNIHMQRLSVRIDIVNTDPDIEITQITFNNRVKRSYLSVPNQMPAEDEWFESKTYRSLALKPTAEDPDAGKYEAEIYSYENYMGTDNEDKLPELVITYTVEGGAPKTHTIKFYDSKASTPEKPFETPLALKRNHLYKITLKGVVSPVFNLEVLDWDAETQFDIPNPPVEVPFTPTANEMFAFETYKKYTGDSRQTWDTVRGGNSQSGTGTDGSICPDGWRIPTLEEAILISVYKDALETLPNFKPLNAAIWCGNSKLSSGYAFNVSNGSMTSKTSTSTGGTLRCVREITTVNP